MAVIEGLGTQTGMSSSWAWNIGIVAMASAFPRVSFCSKTRRRLYRMTCPAAPHCTLVISTHLDMIGLTEQRSMMQLSGESRTG